MDLILIIIGAFFIVAGFLGSFLPVLPGPPLSYLGLLVMQLSSSPPFSLTFMVVWLLIVIALAIMDNVIPAWGTRRYGGSSYGIWGCSLGLVAGLFFPPLGIVVGPIVGAFLGELAAGSRAGGAMRSAWGSFMGMLLGTGINVAAAGLMAYYFVTSI